MDLKRGDVVKIPVPFSDVIGFKIRPTIILKFSENSIRIQVLEIHSLKDHHSSSKGRIVKVDSELGKEMGLDNDSIILNTSKSWVKTHFAKFVKENPIGFCSIIDELDPPEVIVKF